MLCVLPGMSQQEITTNTAIRSFLANSNSSSGSSLCDSSSESPRIRMALSPGLAHLTPGPPPSHDSTHARPRSMSVGNAHQHAALMMSSTPVSKVGGIIYVKFLLPREKYDTFHSVCFAWFRGRSCRLRQADCPDDMGE